MITRFKQLYNKLTYSEAYDLKTGKFDSSKINTNKFTPHNLRALLVGCNGAVLVHYVSHSGRPLVESFKFKGPIEGLNQNEQQYNKWYDANFREKKSLIDALWFSQGLKFNYVEEIYLFTDGFDEQELIKEIQGIDSFLSNSNIRSSLKRLERIVKVVGTPITKELVQDLSEYYKTEKFNKNLVSFFKKYEGQCRFDAVELNPERTELGLHLQPGLDSSKYALDCSYSPDLHKDGSTEGDKEQYRLSRYFYLEEQHQKNFLKAESEKKAAENAQKQAELEAQKKQEDYEALKKRVSMYAAPVINSFISNVLGTLESLYSSGFSGFPQIGVLVPNGENSPILCLSKLGDKDSIHNQRTDEGTSSDKKILGTLQSLYPQLSPYMKTDDIVPNFNILKEAGTPTTLWRLHLLLQNPNMTYAKGNNLVSIRKWITETTNYSNAEEWRTKENGGSYKLKSWKVVKQWYSWVLRNIIVSALIENGVTGVDSDDAKVIETSRILAANLKNVAVVSSRDKLVEMEIRVSSGSELDSENIIFALKKKLNEGFDSGEEVVSVEERSKNSNNVKVLNVVFDKSAASKTTLFAGDVIQTFIDSKETPTWSNALLGRNEDGTPMFWDRFMSNEENTRCYTIYASSGSGKGTMTSTLVAAALCDGREVFYTDGKPENGPVMGMLAWKKGKEAYVFDGKECGSAPFNGLMESYTFNQRAENEVEQYYSALPSKLFNDKYFPGDKKKQFLGLMRYIKSLDLCFKTIQGRQAGTLPMDNWQVWIFDELTSMSNRELQVRNIFRQYCEDKGVSCSASSVENGKYKPITKLGKVNPEILNKSSMVYDEGIAYIKAWLDFNQNITAVASDASTIYLRKANANMIFIFQEPSWLADGRHGQITTLGNVILSLNAFKIVGKGGIVNGAGDYGDGTMGNLDWVKKLKSGRGYWAISTGTDIRKSPVKLFKPFNIYTVPNQKDALDTVVPNGRNATDYFEGYLTKLTEAVGIDPATVLESAYVYADNAVKSLGLTQGSIKDYIYDCSLAFGNKNAVDSVGINSEYVEEESADVRLKSAISKFEGAYTTIINEIEKDRNTLDTIQRKENNTAKFNNKKDELLSNFDGKYREKKDKFFEKITDGVKDEDLRIGVKSEYTSRFDKDFNRIKDEIKAKQFIVGEQPQGVQGAEPEDNYSPGLHITDSNQSFNTQGSGEKQNASNSGSVNNQQELPPRDQRPQRPQSNSQSSSQSAQQSNQNINNQSRQGRIVHPTQIPISNADPLYNQKVNKAQNERVNAANGHTVYNRTLHIKDNPFQFYKDGSAMSTLLSINDMSKILEQDIETNICPNQMVTTFAVQNGQIYINGVAYLPTFEDNLLMSLPLSVRDKIAEGQLAEFFNLHTVRKYKNLEQLLILDGNLAQGRARKEMGIGFRKKWSVLFKKFKHLQYIQVGNIYYHRENPDSNVEEAILDRFKTNPKLTFGSGNRGTLMDRVWDSTPVRIIARGIGWTGATAFVWAGATLFGPIGLLFGAFTMASAFKEIKNNKASNGQIRSGTTSNHSKSASSSKKGNSKKNNGFSKEYD